jgi:hypothetical protein
MDGTCALRQVDLRQVTTLPHPGERPLGRVSKDEAGMRAAILRDGAPGSASALPGTRLLRVRVLLAVTSVA